MVGLIVWLSSAKLKVRSPLILQPLQNQFHDRFIPFISLALWTPTPPRLSDAVQGTEEYCAAAYGAVLGSAMGVQGECQWV